MAKLLLVEDEAILQRMYQKKFENDGYEVETAGNGKDALAKLESFKPDLALLDVMMPEMNGLELLKALKANEATKAIPVIMLTNLSSPDMNVKEALKMGALDYLVKSDHTPEEVVARVKAILGKQGGKA